MGWTLGALAARLLKTQEAADNSAETFLTSSLFIIRLATFVRHERHNKAMKRKCKTTFLSKNWSAFAKAFREVYKSFEIRVDFERDELSQPNLSISPPKPLFRKPETTGMKLHLSNLKPVKYIDDSWSEQEGKEKDTWRIFYLSTIVEHVSLVWVVICRFMVMRTVQKAAKCIQGVPPITNRLCARFGIIERDI